MLSRPLRTAALGLVTAVLIGAGAPACVEAAGTVTSPLTPTAPFATAPTTAPAGHPRRPRQLPFTGDDLWPESLAAVALVAGGLALRRRPRTGVAARLR